MSAGQLRTIKSRIRSVENTKKITRAMEMVSASKLKRVQGMMMRSRPYTQGLEDMLSRLMQDQRAENSASEKAETLHPFFEERDEKKSLVVLMTSDAGLCGSYNTDLIQLTRKHLGQCQNHPQLIGIGKMGIRALRRDGFDFIQTYTDIKTYQLEDTIKSLSSELQNAYLSKRVDAVYVIYSHFITISSYKNVVEKILPLKEPAKTEPADGRAVPYIYEPSPENIFKQLIPAYFVAKTRAIYLEALVSEYMARMNAMHLATKNADDMVDSLVLVRNKVRQAIITKEIIEVVSGSRALKS